MRVNEMVVDDTTKMNVRWKSRSQVKRARDVRDVKAWNRLFVEQK